METRYKMKKGQVTVFIIVGVVVLMVLILFFLVSKAVTVDQLASETEGKFNPDSVKLYVDNCLQRGAISGLETVFAQGGYYEYPLNMELFAYIEEEEVLELPYYFAMQQPNFPSLPEIEMEVSKSAKEYFNQCIRNFEDFQQYKIEAGEPQLEVHFTERSTQVSLEYLLAIRRGDQETSLSQFRIVIPFAFLDKYQAIENYLSLQEQEPDYFLVSEMAHEAEKNNYLFGFKQFGEAGESIAVDLVYDEPAFKEPLTYSFALNYDWTGMAAEIAVEVAELEPAEPAEMPVWPTIKRLPSWEITEPGIHTFPVEAAGEEMVFKMEPDDLYIDSRTGLVTLNTGSFPNDEYLYYVIVSDVAGRTVAAPLIININTNPGSFPIIEPVSSQSVRAGEEFYYQIKVLNGGEQPLLFTDQSYLFDIGKRTGEIRFTPTEEDTGIHSVRIGVENEYGYSWQRWELEVR